MNFNLRFLKSKTFTQNHSQHNLTTLQGWFAGKKCIYIYVDFFADENLTFLCHSKIKMDPEHHTMQLLHNHNHDITNRDWLN